MENHQKDWPTARWLKQNGISAKHFASTDILLLQAQRAAHHAVTHHAGVLTQDQYSCMQRFLHAMRCERTRSKITTRSTYQVLNTASKIHRQIYRRRRQF